MILLFTGNGKGKTTAALGQMFRAAGRGKKTLMIQFIKGPWISGEDEFAKRYNIPKENFEIRKLGKGFVGILEDNLPREEHEKAAEDALQAFVEAEKSGEWHTIVLDEINVAASLGLLKIDNALNAIKNFPPDNILVMTGRNAPQEFMNAADLVTEMKEVKHPFNDGEKAKYAVEF
ncbi:MAG: cob(I)yrinic acid a,c-diamide adenosyltransferase [Candidatus Liptonbacteria bacterium]